MQPSIYLLHFSRPSYAKNLVFPLKTRLPSSLHTIVRHSVPPPVQKVWHRLRLQRGKMWAALWERLLPSLLVSSGNELYGSDKLACSGKVQLYPAPLVIAKGKALFFRQRYSGDHGIALGARHDVMAPHAGRRGRPEAKITYKKLAWQFYQRINVANL